MSSDTRLRGCIILAHDDCQAACARLSEVRSALQAGNMHAAGGLPAIRKDLESSLSWLKEAEDEATALSAQEVVA